MKLKVFKEESSQIIDLIQLTLNERPHQKALKQTNDMQTQDVTGL